ncbi:MAG TPA: hypothetical protein VIK91_22315 [Nannocystis sp.]
MPPHHPSEIDWGEMVLPPPPPRPIPPELAAQVRAAFSTVPSWTYSLLWCPWVLEAMLAGILVPLDYIDPNLVGLVRLVIAQDNSCRYCYGTARAFLRILGYSEEFVRVLEHDLLRADLDPARRAVLDYARLVSRANPRPGDGQRQHLRQLGHSDRSVDEFTAYAAIWVMETRITTLGAIPPSPVEELPDRWWMKLLRPLAAGKLRRDERNVPLAVVDPARRIAVFDDLVGVLGDLPVARNVRKIVDLAFGDGPLPRRTRVILTAVICRALGCDTTQRILGALLGPGDPDWPALDAMLTRLDADWLDDRERLLIPIARETARVTQQPRLLQRRMLDLRAHVTPAEFIDFIGVVSTANMLGRLGVLLP